MVRRIWRWTALALTVAAIVAGVVYHSWVDAQARFATAMLTIAHVPVLTWAVKGLTDDPRVSEIVVAGEPTTLARPGGGKRWPAIVFLNGATDRGRHHPDVQKLARGLARAGFLVLVPELPGLRRYEFTTATLRRAVEVAVAAGRREDVRDGRVGLLGVSTGATLALLVAEDPRLAGRLSVAAGFAPFTDLENVIMLATTGYYRSGGRLTRYDAEDFLGLAVGRSVAAAMPPGPDRRRLVRLLAGVDKDAADPLGVLRNRRFPGLGPDGRATVRLLTNLDPKRFDSLFAALPPAMQASIRRLSPIRRAEAIRAPVELATAPHDKYFPTDESRAVVRRAPDARVTVTRTLEHAIPKLSLSDVADLVRFDGYAVRVLRTAA